MRFLRRWAARIAGAFRKEHDERDFAEEMESHLQLHIADNLRAGMSLREAKREALIKLGGVEQTRHDHRRRRALPVLDILWQDLRFGARTLRKSPGFTIVAVLTLALGIAANATIFSFVSAAQYKKPAVADPDTAMVVYGTSSAEAFGPNLNPVSAPNFFSWKKQNDVFSDMAASDPYFSSSLTGEGEPEGVGTTRVTSNYFSVLGVVPELGRAFASGDDQRGREHVVILSHDLWQRKYGADASLLGKTVRINREPFIVIGVMPRTFRLMPFQTQLWIPLPLSEADQGAGARSNRNLFLFARRKPGVTLQQAQANVQTLARIAGQDFPQSEKGWSANTLTLQEYTIREFNAGPAFVILLTAVGFVLLIACANVAGLLLARATGRGREMAVRVAIGAGRLRLVRQLMTEALLIAGLGALAGLALSLVGERLMQASLTFNDEVQMLELKTDWHVLAYTSVISILSAIIFGLVPAKKAWSSDLFETLKNDTAKSSGGKSRGRLRSLLVAAEVALSLVLLTAAGILILGISDEFRRDLGFDPNGLLTARLSLPEAVYQDPQKQVQFYRQLVAKLDAAPGAQKAAVTSVLPATGPEWTPFLLKGQESTPPGERPRARHMLVSTDYFDVTRTALISGRTFSEADSANTPAVAVVSEKFVEKFFPGGNAVGQQVRIDSGDARAAEWRQIVGVVKNVKSWPLQNMDDAEFYEPFQQHPIPEMAVLLRAERDPESLAPALRAAVWSIDPEQPLGSEISLPEVLSKETTGDRIMMTLMGTFGGLALVLSAVGLYGLVAYSVGQRTRELGIRLALGADKKSILRLVLLQGMKLASIGVLIGMAAALPLPRILASLFQDFPAVGNWLFVFVPALVTCVALLACYVPAWRAGRVDPMVALRYE